MKVFEINSDYYYCPSGITGIDDFVKYANEHYNTFIELTRLETDNCAFPYFIDEDKKRVLVNIATMKSVSEEEVTVLSRLDYDNRLEQIIKEKCVNCVHYEDDAEEDNFKGHRSKLTLDGECWCYEKKR